AQQTALLLHRPHQRIRISAELCDPLADQPFQVNDISLRRLNVGHAADEGSDKFLYGGPDICLVSGKNSSKELIKLRFERFVVHLAFVIPAKIEQAGSSLTPLGPG